LRDTNRVCVAVARRKYGASRVYRASVQFGVLRCDAGPAQEKEKSRKREDSEQEIVKDNDETIISVTYVLQRVSDWGCT